MRIVSWNVNGIRSVLKKGFREFVERDGMDVLCLQETRTPPPDFRLDIDGYAEYWNPARRRGYSGTAVLTRIAPCDVRMGIGVPEHDTEGRVVTLEFPTFHLVDVYVPNSQRGLERLPYRTRKWDVDFRKYLKSLERRKPVVVCGDFNVAHTEIDLANPKANMKNHGFTPEERAGFDALLKAGFIDTFREFERGAGHYTWWSPMGQCRRKNIGWRIDYVCISRTLRPRLRRAFILADVFGSDHCPVGIELEGSG